MLTLLVNNTTGSGTGTGTVMVNGGGTLGGTGSISGTVTVNSSGHVAPGASIESLDVGSLVLNTGSILDFELGAPGSPGINSDLINVIDSGGLTLAGGAVASSVRRCISLDRPTTDMSSSNSRIAAPVSGMRPVRSRDAQSQYLIPLSTQLWCSRNSSVFSE